ncbi:acylase [Congregibacter brevis]|uniref:Acylase n=1 Tax=Congregibacter brevis TaxID=3081201 RepID=A0ABZ0I8C8_9GAMM|nr:acylase [Congregibacter sp. IMCC45268]
MRMPRILMALVLIIALAAITNVLSTSPPTIDSTALLSLGEKYNVRLIRDEFGVPHIYGESDADTAFGLGYAQAEDDFATLQDVVLATRGKLAAVRGPDAAKTDYLIQLMGVWEAVDEGYESKLSQKARDVAEAYADGVNLYAAQHPNIVEGFVLPITGKDLIAGFTFKLPLFYGFDQTLSALFDGSDRELALQGDKALTFIDHARSELGSQGVAIAPQKSSDGYTRLLVNSHQPLTGPVAWYEARLHSKEGWDMAGATFPGSPVILHGHNRHLGWSSTVNKPDLVDVYQLTMNPENDNEYLLDGEWIELETRTAEILVRVFGPFRWTFKEPLYSSKHGPVVKLDHGTFALRWSGMGEIRTLDQYLALNKATNMQEFEAALAIASQPSINQVYADKEGNIAHYYNAMFPERIEGWDWQKDLPGDKSELIWDSYLPFSTIPATRNPSSGFVFNANNSPYLSSVGPGQPQPSEFSKTMGIETGTTNRALRLKRLLSASEKISREDFYRIKYDVFYDEDLPAMLRLRKFIAQGKERLPVELHPAFDLLASWDMGTQSDNPAAALAVLTMARLIDSRRRTEGVDLAQQLANAQSYLRTHFDRIDPEYGEVVRHQRGDKSWPLDGGPDTLRAVYTEEDMDSGQLYNVAGDSYIMFVEWDRDGNVSSRAVHNFGSATLDKSSPHYADQAALFVEHKDKAVRLKLEELLPFASRDYRPGVTGGSIELE